MVFAGAPVHCWRRRSAQNSGETMLSRPREMWAFESANNSVGGNVKRVHHGISRPCKVTCLLRRSVKGVPVMRQRVRRRSRLQFGRRLYVSSLSSVMTQSDSSTYITARPSVCFFQAMKLPAQPFPSSIACPAFPPPLQSPLRGNGT